MAIAAIVAAVGAIVAALINSSTQSSTNQANIDYQKQAYATEQADQRKAWEITNEYNSPQAQMARYQEAGLNPNLLYGNSAGGGNATPLSTPNFGAVNLRSPEWGNALGAGTSAPYSFLSQMYDLDIKKAQADNLKAQNTVILQDGVLRSIQAEQAGFDLGFDRDLREVSADARRESLRQLKTQTDLSINRDAREAAMNSSNVMEAAERMRNMVVQRETMKLQQVHTAADTARIREDIKRIRTNVAVLQKEGTLKDLDIELRKAGIQPNDPLWSRVVGRFLSNMTTSDGSFLSVPDWKSGVKAGADRLWNYFMK